MKQRTVSARPTTRASENAARPLDAAGITNTDLVLMRPTRARIVREPALSLPGDGRLVFNVAAVGALSGRGRLRAVKFYVTDGGERYLVVRAARLRAHNAVRLYRTGAKDRKTAWVTMMGRSEGLLRRAGLVGRCRFVGSFDETNRWLVFNLASPRPYYSKQDPVDPTAEAIARWAKVAPTQLSINVGDLLATLVETAKRAPEIAFLLQRPGDLAPYLERHASYLAERYGLHLRGRGVSMVVERSASGAGRVG